MKRLLTAVLALACSLALARSVSAAGTEFGIQDDLTVLGQDGTASDPDLEVKGFSVFGATASAYNISAATGNVVIMGNLQASATAYFGSSITVAGSGVFLSTVTMAEGMLKYGTAPANKVLKSGGDGYVYWGTDDTGSNNATGGFYRLKMEDGTGSQLVDSPLVSNAGSNSVTAFASSMTIQGYNGDGLAVFGATNLNGTLSVIGANLTSLGGALNVTGASTLAGALTVNNAAYFGAGPTISTFTTAGLLNMAVGSSITLVGAGAKIVLPNAPVNNTDAANKAYVDSQIGGGGPWQRDNAINAVKLSTQADNVGIGIAVPLAKLHVSSASAGSSDMLLAVSTGTAAEQEVFSVNGAGDTVAKGNSQQGNALTNEHSINRAKVSGTALAVDGAGTANTYVAQFYSGGVLAAWIRQKP